MSIDERTTRFLASLIEDIAAGDVDLTQRSVSHDPPEYQNQWAMGGRVLPRMGPTKLEVTYYEQ